MPSASLDHELPNNNNSGNRVNGTDGVRQRNHKTNDHADHDHDHTDTEKPSENMESNNQQPRQRTVNGTTNSTSPSSPSASGSTTQQQQEQPKGIRFAPLRVPLRRRKQTLAVLVHCSCLMMSIPLFFFCCAVPLMWPLIIPYFLMIVVSSASTNGRLRWRSERFRSLPIWTWFANYFPAQLHKTADLPADRKYIFGYHPHGIISHGAWVAFGTNALGFREKYPGITNSLLTLDSNFNIPFYREYLLMAGMCSVARESIINILSSGGPDKKGQGRAVTIVIGGARESLQANPGTMRLVLHGRAGFIKVAMATGADLVPVLGFGEVDLYTQLQGGEHPLLHRFQMHVLKVWKFTLPFMRGRGIFNYDYGLMPYRHPLNIVVGRPIPVQKATSETLDPAEVDRLHELYCEELRRLWDTYKDEYAPDRVEEMQILP
ncbi:diacylglycerol O-acyltransferase 1 [Sporothrix stenoceras]|uniref:Diacylglycerol O-acyltransferase n=1 Tax=Sporothrix stenoceras TaxID=5173 RepID=A0ABR3YPM1_9PEZI